MTFPWMSQGIGFDPSYFRQSQFEPELPRPDNQDYTSGLDQAFAQNTPAMDQYREHIGGVPSRENYTQNIWQKIATALAGAGTALREGSTAGMSVVRGIQESPYQRAMQDFNAKGQYLKDAASIEERGLGDKVNYMRGLLAHQAAKAKEGGVQSRFNRTAGQADQRLDLDKRKHELEKEKAEVKRLYDAGMMDIAEFNARTSRISASIAGMNAQTNRAGLKLDQDKFARGDVPDPSEQVALENAAFMNEVRLDPRFAEVVTADGKIDWDEAAEKGLLEELEEFRTHYKGRTKVKYGY